MSLRQCRITWVTLWVILVLALSACSGQGGQGAAGGENGATPVVAVNVAEEEGGEAGEAEEAEAAERPEAMGVMNAEHVYILASNLSAGHDVYNLEGDEIGEAEDILIDRATGTILFLIVEYGGYMGVGDTDMPIPLTALEWGGQETLTLRVPEAQLESRPDTPNEWPSQAGATWDDELRSFWTDAGVETIPTVEDPETLQRFSDLLPTGSGDTSGSGSGSGNAGGSGVGGSSGEEQSGQILVDLIVDLAQGRVKYALLNLGEQALYIVPWQALAAVGGAVVFDPELDGERLMVAPRLPSKQPGLWTEPGWDAEIVDFWKQAGYPLDAEE